MKKIKVILLKDIDKLGRKYEIKEVKAGYARNFLLPKKLVKIATDKNIEWVKNEIEKTSKKSEEELTHFQKLASKVDGLEIVFKVKEGKEKQLFESIDKQKVVKKLKEMKLDIKPNQIQSFSPIKKIGEFPIKIKFPHNLESEIKIIITPEVN